VSGRIAVCSFLGNTAKLSVELEDGSEIMVSGDRSLASRFTRGMPARLSWSRSDVRLLKQ
jgi:hypothetical protein